MNDNIHSYKHCFRITGPIALVFVSIVGSLVLNKAIDTYYKRATIHENIITTRGISEQIVKSDEATIKIKIQNETNDLGDINTKRMHDCETIINYIQTLGIKKEDIISINRSHEDQLNRYIEATMYKTNSEERRERSEIAIGIVKRFSIIDEITIKTTDVDLAEKFATNMIECTKKHPNICFSVDVDYRYTKLGNLRIQMIDSAAQDAYNRSQKIVSHTNNKIVALSSATISKFDISAYGVSSDGYSHYAAEDKSKYKNISVVVNMHFKIA